MIFHSKLLVYQRVPAKNSTFWQVAKVCWHPWKFESDSLWSKNHGDGKSWPFRPSGWWFGTWLLWLSIYWESSSQLTKSIIFQRGRYTSTTNQSLIYHGFKNLAIFKRLILHEAMLPLGHFCTIPWLEKWAPLAVKKDSDDSGWSGCLHPKI